ncbi:MAG: UDP-N-acetylmuramoyl-L-alanyl-D-glutamate--2,6-diaminopimelate ligase [Bacteroidales bacterium]|nr:UDP-N-acetylmuramoyl-L-alanyl-D-glutamate--2,6-diaminopimelate ligase [Bacteroidales bacterium]MCF8387625.1 UDP-N-acetylmuramoyl-L-alanyl-D-glutamate--2,6-diaminopimelate ligase [Bacteroidales bacterium]MCF8397933.1 UDP-N-acetylmuramoyl-L-alanyl-D-glutamate--2,6-diaminopimelate ligase [Bacteroidales bacterium]
MAKQLSNILIGVGILEQKGSLDKKIEKICFDSREADSHALFVAMKGTQVDGHDFISIVLKNGAKVIVCEDLPDDFPNDATILKVKDSHEALGIIASNFYDRPSGKLKLVGVTGTNGKTTIVHLLHSLFTGLGYQSGMLSTIGNLIHDKKIQATHTTPDPVSINKLLKQMLEEGCSHCFIEVSSHAIDQKRIAGLNFAGGIFTNITHDHLDYHKTFAAYLSSKKEFFDQLPAEAFALVNKDDKNGPVMLQNTKATGHTYALKSNAEFKGKILENQFEGLNMMIGKQEAWFQLSGVFNAYNLMAVYATAVLLGENATEVLAKLSQIKGAEGRMDFMRTDDGIMAIVDYAHTPDALKNILETINEVRTGSEELITVVGTGGDRDRTKRPVMARTAASLSTKVIFTSDNPRSENPDAIIEDMVKGVEGVDYKKILSISKRDEAIKTACMLVKPGDIILVAGKGHEKYQDIKGVKHPFDDKEKLREYLNLRKEGN